MSGLPTGTAHMKIPTLGKLSNNSNLTFSNMEHIKHLVYTEKTPSTITVSTTMKTKYSMTKPSTTTTKISIDGKVVDIDVLTKLQEQNGGNIISFKASKEFLSNLAAAKANVTNAVIATAQKKQGISVFKASKTRQIIQPVTRKTIQEKLLLPKTQINGYVRKPNIEVKKFAPEIKGLLSGMSTALNTSAVVATNIKSSNSFQVLKSINVSPKAKAAAIKCSETKSNLLLAIKTTEPNHASFPSHTTTIIAAVPRNQTTMITTLPIMNERKQVRKTVIQTVTSSTNKFPNSSSSTTIVPNILMKVPSIATSMESAKIKLLNKANVNKARDNLQAVKVSSSKTFYPPTATTIAVDYTLPKITYVGNNNPTNSGKRKLNENSMYHIQKMLDNKTKGSNTILSNGLSSVPIANKTLIKPIPKEEKINLKGKISNGYQEAPKEREKLSGFTELYETAVQNLLSIKAFTDDITSEKDNSSSFEEFEQAFQSYLEKPMEIEKKINHHLSQYYNGDTKNMSLLYDGEPTNKRQRLQDDKVVSLSTSTSGQANLAQTIELSKYESAKKKLSSNGYLQVLDLKSVLKSGETEIKTKKQNNTPDYDNRKFFSQFLSEQASSSHRSYFSHVDFPWLHPSYMYERYYHPGYYYYNSAQSAVDNYDQSKQVKEETKDETKSHKSKEQREKSRMKLNTVKKGKGKEVTVKKKREETETNSSIDDEVKKINKNKKNQEKAKSSNKPTPTPEKKIKTKDSLKYRPYSLRQRVKALKKAKKLGKIKSPEKIKYVLKDLTVKSVTKKELFLGQLGLRRILKKIERKEKETK